MESRMPNDINLPKFFIGGDFLWNSPELGIIFEFPLSVGLQGGIQVLLHLDEAQRQLLSVHFRWQVWPVSHTGRVQAAPSPTSEESLLLIKRPVRGCGGASGLLSNRHTRTETPFTDLNWGVFRYQLQQKEKTWRPLHHRNISEGIRALAWHYVGHYICRSQMELSTSSSQLDRSTTSL